MDPFLGRMRVFDGRPERDHVHADVFFSDDPTLQAGMNGFNLRLFTEDLLINLAEFLQQNRLQVRLPAGIAPGLDDPGAGQLGGGPDFFC